VELAPKKTNAASHAVEMTRRGKRGKLKSKFSTLSTALGNPAKSAGFPHFHSDDGWFSHNKNEQQKEMFKSNILKLQDDKPKVTFLNCLTGLAFLRLGGLVCFAAEPAFNGILEFPDSFTQPFAQFRQLAGTKDDQDNDKDENNVGRLE
jgi:hypothetical protein